MLLLLTRSVYILRVSDWIGFGLEVGENKEMHDDEVLANETRMRIYGTCQIRVGEDDYGYITNEKSVNKQQQRRQPKTEKEIQTA